MFSKTFNSNNPVVDLDGIYYPIHHDEEHKNNDPGNDNPGYIFNELKKCIYDKYIWISTGFDFEDASTILGVKTNYNGKELLETKVNIENCQ